MVGIPSPELTPDVEQMLVAERIGNVCLFARNLRDSTAGRDLCNSLQALAERELPAPMLIATDQEGGPVQRLSAGATPLPSAMALGAAGPAACRQVAYIAARELRAVGITMAFAPVLDVNVDPRNPVIGIRSFGDSPELVAACGVASIAGLQSGGVAATAKHFPGHGDTAVDSHLALPVLPHDLPRLERVELIPFRAAIEAGVDAVMVSHLAVPALDPSGAPASLSPELNSGLLRRRLRFGGVVCTDCMEMSGARTGRLGFGELAVRAFLAGADLVLVSHRRDRQLAASAALRDAVESGRVPVMRLRESASRVLKLKRRLAAAPAPPWTEVGSAAHLATVTEAAVRAVTVKRRESLPGGTTAVIAFGGAALSPAEPQVQTDHFLEAARALGLATLALPVEPDAQVEARALRFARSVDVLVVGSRRLAAVPRQAELTRALASLRPVALVALREPYDLDRVPEAATLVAAYGDTAPQARAALAAALD